MFRLEETCKRFFTADGKDIKFLNGYNCAEIRYGLDGESFNVMLKFIPTNPREQFYSLFEQDIKRVREITDYIEANLSK